ncbi:MAG: hypothetical protein JNL28_15775 [Planctomycetes bacterium]|nr:hypothetical protein [Planctomycetota bacterium]
MNRERKSALILGLATGIAFVLALGMWLGHETHEAQAARIDPLTKAEGVQSLEEIELEHADPIQDRILAASTDAQTPATDPVDLRYWKFDLPELRVFRPEDQLTGTVLRANGQPAVRAGVYLAGHATRTNERGEFRIGIRSVFVGEEHEVWAFEPGSQPARVTVAKPLMLDAQPRPAVVLTLGAPVLSIQGRLMDSEHRPLVGWKLNLEDPTRISPASASDLGDYAEPLIENGSTSGRTTDSNGAFEWVGLMDREYHFTAFDPATLRSLQSPGLRAGARAVEIIAPPDTRVAELAGRLVGLDNTPIAGALVTLESTVGTGRRPPVSTDANGMFQMQWVPRTGVRILVQGDMITERPFELSNLDLDSLIVLTTARLCAVRITGLPEGPDLRVVHALTSWGSKWDVKWKENDVFRSATSLEFTGSAVPDLYLDERIVKLRLITRPGRGVQERAVALTPGTLTVVDW